MLLFLDDSYERTDEGFSYVLAGYTVPEDGYRRLVQAVVETKQRYFVRDRNMTSGEREKVWETHFVVGDEPANIELKGSLLLSSSALRRTGEQPKAALSIAEAVLDALGDAGGRVFSAIDRPPTMRHGHVHQVLLQVLDDAQRIASEGTFLVIDSSNPNADRLFSRRFTELMLSEEGSRRFPSFLPTPFVLDTKTSPGLQVADLVAHIVLHRSRPAERRKPLGRLYDMVRDLE